MMITDPIERIIANSLDARGIEYDRDGAKGRRLRHPDVTLDFYLPKFDIWIECKQFYSDRITRQMQQFDNVIVIQGRAAALAFASMTAEIAGQRSQGPQDHCGSQPIGTEA